MGLIFQRLWNLEDATEGVIVEAFERLHTQHSRRAYRSPRSSRVSCQAVKPHFDEEAVMRRTLVLALTALALLGALVPDAFAQAPTPKFLINGLIDQIGTYAVNTS